MTRKQRVFTFGLLFVVLTIFSMLLPPEHWFQVAYLFPSIVAFFMLYVPLSAVFTSNAFGAVLSIILMVLPAVLYTFVVVAGLEIVDRVKAKLK
jgi:inner membrane protein involved in colicin E2 resistance